MKTIELCTDKSVYKILQLSDMQLIDSTQQRQKDRLSSVTYAEWLPENIERNCFDIVRQIVQKTEPDLIVCAGDQVYGQFDDTGRVFEQYVQFMDSLHIPWSPIFGNHDRESAKGVDWMCACLAGAQHCLFDRGDTDGEGNYGLLLRKNGRAVRKLYCMDTHNRQGLTPGQMDWLKQDLQTVKRKWGEIALTVIMHIQPVIFAEAMKQIGFDGSPVVFQTQDDLQLCLMAVKNIWDTDGAFWNLVKKYGIDSVLVGHEHCNAFSVLYDGVRLQYGLKSSTYDRNVYLKATDVLSGSFATCGIPLVGGTIMHMDTQTGDFTHVQNVFYNANHQRFTCTPNLRFERP